jgi:hypothetical protein
MRSRHAIAAALVAASLASTLRDARADAPIDRDPEEHRARVEAAHTTETVGLRADMTAHRLAIHADAYVGYGSEDRGGDGLLAGLDALARWRIVEAGIFVESSSGRSETILGGGVMAGLAFYRWKAIGFDLLGAFGGHIYDHVGSDIFAPGASGSLPFLEARAGITFLPLRPFSFGAWGFYADDLTRVTKNYSVVDVTPGGTTLTRQTTIGEASYGVMFRLGVDVSL